MSAGASEKPGFSAETEARVSVASESAQTLASSLAYGDLGTLETLSEVSKEVASNSVAAAEEDPFSTGASVFVATGSCPVVVKSVRRVVSV